MTLDELEPRDVLSPPGCWPGWDEVRLLGLGLPADALRVYLPDPGIAPRVARLLAPVPGVAVVVVRPDQLPGRYVEVAETPAGWLRPWGGGANDGGLTDPHPNNLEPHAAYVDAGLPPALRAVVAAHEVGHVLGLTHTADPGNLMYGGGLTAGSVGLTAGQIETAGALLTSHNAGRAG